MPSIRQSIHIDTSSLFQQLTHMNNTETYSFLINKISTASFPELSTILHYIRGKKHLNTPDLLKEVQNRLLFCLCHPSSEDSSVFKLPLHVIVPTLSNIFELIPHEMIKDDEWRTLLVLTDTYVKKGRMSGAEASKLTRMLGIIFFPIIKDRRLPQIEFLRTGDVRMIPTVPEIAINVMKRILSMDNYGEIDNKNINIDDDDLYSFFKDSRLEFLLVFRNVMSILESTSSRGLKRETSADTEIFEKSMHSALLKIYEAPLNGGGIDAAHASNELLQYLLIKDSKVSEQFREIKALIDRFLSSDEGKSIIRGAFLNEQINHFSGLLYYLCLTLSDENLNLNSDKESILIDFLKNVINHQGEDCRWTCKQIGILCKILTKLGSSPTNCLNDEIKKDILHLINSEKKLAQRIRFENDVNVVADIYLFVTRDCNFGCTSELSQSLLSRLIFLVKKQKKSHETQILDESIMHLLDFIVETDCRRIREGVPFLKGERYRMKLAGSLLFHFISKYTSENEHFTLFENISQENSGSGSSTIQKIAKLAVQFSIFSVRECSPQLIQKLLVSSVSPFRSLSLQKSNNALTNYCPETFESFIGQILSDCANQRRFHTQIEEFAMDQFGQTNDSIASSLRELGSIVRIKNVNVVKKFVMHHGIKPSSFGAATILQAFWRGKLLSKADWFAILRTRDEDVEEEVEAAVFEAGNIQDVKKEIQEQIEVKIREKRSSRGLRNLAGKDEKNEFLLGSEIEKCAMELLTK